jgi:hypothetical protein
MLAKVTCYMVYTLKNDILLDNYQNGDSFNLIPCSLLVLLSLTKEDVIWQRFQTQNLMNMSTHVEQRR